MQLTESYTLPVPQQRAWEALNDTAILRQSIPGCESIEPDGENAYALTMQAHVGPVKAHFKGRMLLTDIDAPRAYTIVFEGQGGVAGFGKGSAQVTLEPEGDAATKLSYTAHAQVGGKLAQIGSRLVDGAARKIAGEFFKRFSEHVGGPAASDAADEEGTLQTASGATESEAESLEGAAGAAAGTEADTGETKRKKSWKAWISRS
ncbi:CoxG family protein [Paraburkholderia kururiensis]|uniref:Carbon monoxide dehydrogenase subunit G n=1 Tax=Paraburkholderia kururiensis TaxID=984307 RepID=A0ABZ0WG93_9BURK|nr:carbon monoxide dehydrogenase subunit G [Paraburkholderia kururiensis]WQD76374.1 carbon monoxide dehydrogenase subunit G [Paraburkholderia kururiensis]